MGETKARKKEIIKIVYELRYKYKLVLLLKIAGIAKSSYFYEINTYNKEDVDKDLKD